MDQFEQRLQEMQGNMKKQMEGYKPGGNFAPLPEIDALCKVKPKMTFSGDSTGNKLMVLWTFVVAEGEYEGRKLFDNTVLEGNEGRGSVHETGSNICRGRVEALGKEWPEGNLKRLRQVIEELDREEPEVQVHATPKAPDSQGRVNHRIYLRVDSAAAPATSEAPATEDTPPSRPLIDFCTKHELNGITDDMDDETIIESFRASGITFEAGTEIDGDEVEMLRSLGAEDLLTEPPRKATPAKITKKPVKKGKR